MNFKLPKIKSLFVIASFLFLSFGVLAGGLIIQQKQNINEKAAANTVLSVYPKAQSANTSDDLTFSVVMDTGTNNVTGFDLVLLFDPNTIQIKSLHPGNGISDFGNTITNTFDNTFGTINFTAFTLDKNLAVKGSDIEIVNIDASVNTNAVVGSHLINFDPSSAVSATSENQNALTNTNPGTINVTVQPTASPSPAPGNPNSCNGTCGSNANCQSNYLCHQGFCRNPSCSWDVSCECKIATPVPTKKPIVSKTTTPTTKPVVTITPIVVDLEIPPEPTANSFWQDIYNDAPEVPQNDPTLAPINLPDSTSTSMLPWIIGSLVAVAITLVLIAIGFYKHANIRKSKPPVIKL